MPITRNLDNMLELPLFQGMSKSDLTDIFDTIRPVLATCKSGKLIIGEGAVCDRLYFIVKGHITSECISDDHGYSIVEELQAPEVIQPERLFGLNQRFTRTVTAATTCEVMSISKAEVLLLSAKYEIFRLNLLNIVSTWGQRMSRYPWRVRPQGVRPKLIRFVEAHCLRPARGKILTITMERLAAEIGESRLNVSRELKAMRQEGLIETHRGVIIIPAFEQIRG